MTIKFGVVFPQTEFGSTDPGAIRDFAQTVEGLGYSHVIAYDHVLGANPDRPGGWAGPYTHESSFFEPFVLFSFMAAVTNQIGFLTGILILPQRQTVLVAKQSATLDVLCGGKFRLGVGLGWNPVEYTALNEDFHNRGRRLEEQVEVLRMLWTKPLVDFKGKYHTIPDAGLKPLPIQRPIPIWFGGTADRALLRAARFADGWLPQVRTAEQRQAALDIIQRGLDQAGRERSSFGIEPRLPFGAGDPEVWTSAIHVWQDVEVTQFSINTLGSGFTTPTAHLEALRKFAGEIGIQT